MFERFLHWVGFGLCHQLPERSFFGGGVQSPVCARDTGIYIGFVVALAAIALLHRPQRPREFPSRRVWLVIGAFVSAMGFDGVTSYAGLRETNNDLRLLTGLMAGFAVAAMIAPILNDEVWRHSDAQRVLDPGWRLAVWVSILPVTFALVRWGGGLLGVGYPALVAACILATFSAVNLAIVSMFPLFDRRARGPRDLMVPLSIAICMTFAELQGSVMLRELLLSVVTRVG